MTDPVRPDPADDPADGPVRLVALREEPIDVTEVQRSVEHPGCGAACVFVGTVRATDGGRDVDGLGYSAHPTALSRMRDLCEQVAAEHDCRAVAAVHRVGDLVVGDVAVVVAVATGHRGESFTACRDLIDRLKATVPIWKHQLFADGSDEWVGTP